MHVASPDPELVYVTRPRYTTNGVAISEAHGILRATDVPEEKPAGTFRVVVLGDSIAAAHPIVVGGAPSFPDAMERRLNADGGGRFEVLNFGTDGYGSTQESRLLEVQAGRFAPDLVLVEYCLNDPAASYTPTVWFLAGAEPPSYLLDLVRRRLHAAPSLIDPAHPRYTHGAVDWGRLYARNGEPWRETQRALARIAAWGASHRARVALALFPLLLDSAGQEVEKRQLAGITAQVREAAGAAGMHVIDLGPTFAREASEGWRLLPGDSIHPNARGHLEAAAAIVADLERSGLVPSAAP